MEGATATQTINLDATDNTPELVAAKITSQLNGKTIMINDIEYNLSVTGNGNDTYSVTTEGPGGLTKIESSTPTFVTNPSKAPTTLP